MTIPKDFSANATSFSKDEAGRGAPRHHRRADLADLRSRRPGRRSGDHRAGDQGLNATLTESYLKNIYIGFNSTGKQFTTLASAAGKLSDGTDQLSDGI